MYARRSCAFALIRMCICFDRVVSMYIGQIFIAYAIVGFVHGSSNRKFLGCPSYCEFIASASTADVLPIPACSCRDQHMHLSRAYGNIAVIGDGDDVSSSTIVHHFDHPNAAEESSKPEGHQDDGEDINDHTDPLLPLNGTTDWGNGIRLTATVSGNMHPPWPLQRTSHLSGYPRYLTDLASRFSVTGGVAAPVSQVNPSAIWRCGNMNSFCIKPLPTLVYAPETDVASSMSMTGGVAAPVAASVAAPSARSLKAAKAARKSLRKPSARDKTTPAPL